MLNDDKEPTLWDELWPITDRFEELCITLNIRVPSYTRIPKKWVLEELQAVDPTTLAPDVAETYRYFMSMEKAEFDLMFSELYNPFRLSERVKH